jgi:hypothetical protein
MKTPSLSPIESRLSFGELDRRIHTLEADVALPRARLERLESRFGA